MTAVTVARERNPAIVLGKERGTQRQPNVCDFCIYKFTLIEKRIDITVSCALLHMGILPGHNQVRGHRASHISSECLLCTELLLSVLLLA